MISVLIVDDHPLYRQGTRNALGAAPDVDVVAAVGTAAEALTRCRLGCPDVVLLDINLPDKSGIDTAREIAALCPASGVIALTAHDDDAYVLALAEAGARGYLVKSATDDEIVRAVRAVAGGGTSFAPQATEALLRRARGQAEGPDFGLTERECEVLQAAASGLTNREIGHRLGISERTAQAHLSHIYDKLGAASRTEAVTVALRHGLIELDDGASG
jgi:DNA-binding NarL/FixJ family response regulator